MSFDFGAVLRRRKPEKRLAQFRARSPEALLSATDAPAGLVSVVLDTNVYIRNAQGTLPAVVEALLDRALLFHSSVCLAELATGVANANPNRAGWSVMRDHYEAVINAIPDTRVLVPDAQVWAEAGLVSGILARTQSLQPYQRKELLNDALIFFTAVKAGLPVLTSNRGDFDLLQQIVPEGRFYLY